MTYTPEQLREMADDLEKVMVRGNTSSVYPSWPELARAHADALEELERVRKENTSLRALQVGVKCAYGYRMENGACQLGYPGCACMDDLCATMEWGPGDLHARANKRLQERAERAEAALAECRTKLEVGPRTKYDGIDCRDETIRMLEQKCERLIDVALHKFGVDLSAELKEDKP